MTILLAPMEGLLDFALRDMLTRAGGIDRCVSEFIRITDMLLPDRVFYRVVPELHHGSRTPAGVPVRAQLLGSDPQCLADNAATLARLGSAGIDLNFGCPAKIVNRHGGGAALLQEPDVLMRIVSAVRRSVPADLPVSAKMRLGFNDDSRAEECAQAIAEGGACELVVHARTKAHAYRPPAFWERVADIKAVVNIPLIANGEIWTLADALRCREASGCHDLMLGRGMVADPGLALAILAHDAAQAKSTVDLPTGASSAADRGIPWPELLPLLGAFWGLICAHIDVRHRAGRLKQWLNYLRRAYPQAQQAYDEIRTINDSRVIEGWLERVGALPARASEAIEAPAALTPQP